MDDGQELRAMKTIQSRIGRINEVFHSVEDKDARGRVEAWAKSLFATLPVDVAETEETEEDSSE